MFGHTLFGYRSGTTLVAWILLTKRSVPTVRHFVLRAAGNAFHDESLHSTYAHVFVNRLFVINAFACLAVSLCQYSVTPHCSETRNTWNERANRGLISVDAVHGVAIQFAHKRKKIDVHLLCTAQINHFRP